MTGEIVALSSLERAAYIWAYGIQLKLTTLQATRGHLICGGRHFHIKGPQTTRTLRNRVSLIIQTNMAPFIQLITFALLVKITRGAPELSTSNKKLKTQRLRTASQTLNPTSELSAAQDAQECEGKAVAEFAASMPFLTTPNGKSDFICWIATPQIDNDLFTVIRQ